MQLGLKIAPRLTQTLKPTLQQLQYYRLLQQTNLELELDMRNEVAQNPALEIEEVRRCPQCGEILLDGHPCTTCLSSKADDTDRETLGTEKLDMMVEIYSSSAGSYEASTYESIPEDELPDAFATVVRGITLEDHLKNRVAIDCIDLDEENRILAENIIDLIDSNSEKSTDDEEDFERVAVRRSRVDNPGLIALSDKELAEELDVPVERLSRVRRKVAEIDPIGSGLQSSIEVLALQAELAEELDEESRTALAQIIRNYLQDISKDHHSRVGKKVGLPAKRVRELIEYMRQSFHIHPRRKFEEEEINATVENPYVTADVRIRDNNGEFTVEVLDSGLPQLKINSYYLNSYKRLKKDKNSFTPEERKHIREYFERASGYMENLNSRRQTMLDITEEIIKQQEGFLRKGPLYLKKLTRKQIAETIGVHPSTVSRALAVRFCWLPDNSIVSFNVFFNPATCYIEMIKQILKDEAPGKVFSDEEIRDIMAEQGHDLSRRVITKYRKKGKIPASGRRRRTLHKEAREEEEERIALLEEEGLADDDADDEYGDEIEDVVEDEEKVEDVVEDLEDDPVLEE